MSAAKPCDKCLDGLRLPSRNWKDGIAYAYCYECDRTEWLPLGLWQRFKVWWIGVRP